MNQPLCILLSAYACRPNMGSEPGVGWNLARAIAQHHAVWVLTREDNRPFIEAELTQHPFPNLQFIYCDVPGAKLWHRSNKTVHLHHYLWQLSAYSTAKRLLPQIQWDVIHHVTYVRYSSPSFLSLLPVPFVWGPVGGGEMAPAAFWEEFDLYARVYEVLRYLSHRLGEADPFTRLTATRSALVRATTKDTAARLRSMGAQNLELYSESGLSQEEIVKLSTLWPPTSDPVRFISMARLLHWKGLHLGIRAFAAAKLPDAEYWILGEGPERDRLQQLADDLRVAKQVRFFGKLPRHETLNRLGESHILVHPSLHDSGGWVCLEAMACRRPVICFDLGGPAVQVTESTGIKVAAHSPAQAVCDLASAMTQLATDAELRSRLGKAGQEHVQAHFSWEQKAKGLMQIYKLVSKKQLQSFI